MAPSQLAGARTDERAGRKQTACFIWVNDTTTMFIDARHVPEGGTAQADLCVIGAGAAGISLAMEFVDTPLRVILLESGGLMADSDGHGIYQVVPDSNPHLSVDPSRTWYFGGNTNHWAGNCRPLDEADFEPRDWVRNSGWPIRKHHLLQYYERAQAMCGLSDFRCYDLDTCRPHLNHPPLDVDPSLLTTKVLHTCPVPSFADLYRERLETADNVRVWLGTSARRLKTNAGGDHVRIVETVGADGRRSHIEADVFVLAAGGVENPRLLLCSNDADPNGLANAHDLVGRFFMEHWYVDIPLGRWRGAVEDLDFYGGRQPVGGATVWGQIMLSEELMRKKRLLGLSLWFPSTTPAPLSVCSAQRVMASLRGRARLTQPFTDIRLALSDPGEVARHALRKLSRRGKNPQPREVYSLRVQLEQTPNPENRIRLSPGRDRHGEPRAELLLRLADEDWRSHARSLRIAAAELGLNGRRLTRQIRLMLRAGRNGFFWHHMGTTRMHGDPTQGVVDANCRVHGVSNLFVAGSSVFPTGGTAPPTLTIVALALRLAEHLRQSRGMPGRSADLSR